MKVHFEPYVYLAGLTHKSALIAWGGFYFKVSREAGGWRLMDDEELDHVHPPRSQTIGATSFPYGHAQVEVTDAQGKVVGKGETRTANHVWVSGWRRIRRTAIASSSTAGNGRKARGATGRSEPARASRASWSRDGPTTTSSARTRGRRWKRR
jgi:hypothetical protein